MSFTLDNSPKSVEPKRRNRELAKLPNSQPGDVTAESNPDNVIHALDRLRLLERLGESSILASQLSDPSQVRIVLRQSEQLLESLAGRVTESVTQVLSILNLIRSQL